MAGRVSAVPRIRLASPTSDPDGELPFRILVIADLAGRRLDAPLGERRPIVLSSDGLAGVAAAIRPQAGSLSWSGSAGATALDAIAQIPALAALSARRGVLLAGPRTSASEVLAALLGEHLEVAVAAALAHADVRRLGGWWRGLAVLLAHAGPGVEIALLPATRAELDEDLGDAPELAASGLYRTVHADEYGQHGGRPWGLLVGGFSVDQQPRDLALLRRLAALAALAHAPLVADAAPGLLGLADWDGLSGLADTGAALQAARAFTSWRAGEDARHAALALPPVPLPGPAWDGGEPTCIPAALLVAARLAAVHAATGWCASAAGSAAGDAVAVPAAPAWSSGEYPPPTPCLLTETQARDLAANGLIAVCASRLQPAVCMPAMPTLHSGGNLASQLPMILLADRIAHHLKVLQRERLGSQVDHEELERELAAWLDRHVADSQVEDVRVRSSRPLHSAQIRVRPVAGRAGWMLADLTLRPHLPGIAGEVELSLTSRLERIAS